MPETKRRAKGAGRKIRDGSDTPRVNYTLRLPSDLKAFAIAQGGSPYVESLVRQAEIQSRIL